MKKFFTLLLLLCLFSVSPAQFFELSIHDTTGQVSSTQPLYLDGYIINISNDSLHFNIVRLENNLPSPAWSSSLCIGELCAAPFVDSVSTDSLVPPGDSVYFDLIFNQTDLNPDTATVLLRFATMDDAQINNQRFYASTILTSIKDDSEKHVEFFKLLNNYPNPFNNQTIISTQINRPSKVTLQIYDILGREVFNTFREISSAKIINFRWSGINKNGEELSSGIYFYRVSAQSSRNIKQSEIKKLTLLR